LLSVHQQQQQQQQHTRLHSPPPRAFQEVPAAARQNEEPLRDAFPAVFPELEPASTLADAAVVDFVDSFLNYDWSADLSVGQSDQQQQQDLQQQQQEERQPETIC
jgi:hypothetical protein